MTTPLPMSARPVASVLAAKSPPSSVGAISRLNDVVCCRSWPSRRATDSVPPSVTVPVTANWSCSMPGVLPPTSVAKVDVEPRVRCPATVRRPAAPSPPGANVPWLLRVPVPTSTVPEPCMKPVLTKPPDFLKVAPVATLTIPLCVSPPDTSSRPCSTRAVPVLVKEP